MVNYNSTIPGPIRTEIQTRLKDVEEEEQVRIFYACASGSWHGDFLRRTVTMMFGFCVSIHWNGFPLYM